MRKYVPTNEKIQIDTTADRLADRRVARDLDLEEAPLDVMGVLPSGDSPRITAPM